MRELTDEQTGVALAYAVGGEEAPSRSFKHENMALAVVMSWPLATDLRLHANLGCGRLQADRQNSTTWALALETSGDGGLDAGAEIYGDDCTATWLGVVARYALRPQKRFVGFS